MSGRVALVAILATTALALTGATQAPAVTPRPGLIILNLRTHAEKRFQFAPPGFALSPDRRRMAYIIRNGDGELQLRVRHLDGANDHVLLHSPFPSFMGDPSWSSDGRTIAVPWDSTGCGETDASCVGLWLVRTSGRPPEKLADDAWDAAWAPGSRRLAFPGQLDNAGFAVLTVENADGSGRSTFGARTPVESLSWSGDGTRLLYSTSQRPALPQASVGEVHVVTPAAGLDTVVAKGWFPTWSHDGTLISFLRTTKNGLTLFLRAHGRTRPILNRPQTTIAEAWSPRGHRLAIAVSGFLGARIYLFDPDVDSSPRQIMPRAYGGVPYITWSADGRRLIFVRLGFN